MKSAAPLNLLLPVDLLKTSSNSTSKKSFMKTLKRTGPEIEPWRALLVTGHQPNGNAFTIIL